MPTEDLQAYQRHLESFTEEYRPQGATEAHLVQALADTSWRLNRVAALETNLLSLGVAAGFRPVTHAPQQIQDALAIAAALESMHSQRLSRQFERAVAQLHELQKTRRTQEEQELDNLLDITDMYESKGEPFDSSDLGFVFSEPQINERILARTRERLAHEASVYHRSHAAW
jgi:hypothetical protein